MSPKALERSTTVLDRCDACGAKARVIATFISGELMFCGHHAKEQSAALLTKAVSIYDPDEFILI